MSGLPELNLATIVFFHAHPDDESIITGGSIARAGAAGHRTVVVTATAGEEGEVEPDLIAAGQSVDDLRAGELHEALTILGVDRHVSLGYRDSGMAGTAANDHPACFWQADVASAAGRLTRVLGEERADAITFYDGNGIYGHPDHVMVHRVGIAAAEAAGTPIVLEATINRTRAGEALGRAQAVGLAPEAINTVVDVTPWLEVKLKAMRAHRSQISEDGWLLGLPRPALQELLGVEWYARVRPDPADQWEWLLGPSGSG